MHTISRQRVGSRKPFKSAQPLPVQTSRTPLTSLTSIMHLARTSQKSTNLSCPKSLRWSCLRSSKIAARQRATPCRTPSRPVWRRPTLASALLPVMKRHVIHVSAPPLARVCVALLHLRFLPLLCLNWLLTCSCLFVFVFSLPAFVVSAAAAVLYLQWQCGPVLGVIQGYLLPCDSWVAQI